MIELVNANALHIPLADCSVQMVATSPPYWMLRKYKAEKQLGQEELHDCLGWATGNFCGECYICDTLAWAREVKRVLRDDGTFWCNWGDSYNGSGGAGGDYGKGGLREGQPKYTGRNADGLKPKDMAGIPWRAALALQADGWWLRSSAPWIKRNLMPESATDRPTGSIEYVFLFSKSEHYYYDRYAVKTDTRNRRATDWFTESWHGMFTDDDGKPLAFMVNTSGFSGTHYAVFPPKLVEPMIKAGSSEKGCCPAIVKKLRVKKDLTPDQRERVERFLMRKGLL